MSGFAAQALCLHELFAQDDRLAIRRILRVAAAAKSFATFAMATFDEVHEVSRFHRMMSASVYSGSLSPDARDKPWAAMLNQSSRH